MNKKFLGFLTALTIVASLSACGGAHDKWQHSAADLLKDTNCFENNQEITCDVRSCAQDCKVYVEQGGAFVGVVGLCPDRADGHTVTFTNDAAGPVDILCAKGGNDKPVTLATGLGASSNDSNIQPADPASISQYADGAGASSGGAGGVEHIIKIGDGLEMSDKTPPSILEYRLGGSDYIRITFSEPVQNDDVLKGAFVVKTTGDILHPPHTLGVLAVKLIADDQGKLTIALVGFTEDFNAGWNYTFEIQGGAEGPEDLAGNHMTDPLQWAYTFTDADLGV